MIANRHRAYKHRLATLVAILAFSGCASAPEPRHDSSSLPRVVRFTPSRPVVVIPGFGNSKLWDPVLGAYVWGTARNMVRTSYDDDLELSFDATLGRFRADRLVPRGGFAGSRGPVNVAWRISKGLETGGSYHLAAREGSPAGPAAIYPFGYDFRLSATDNARKLDELIEAIRARNGNPDLEVDVIAHSAGGIVALTYVKLGTADLDRPESWDAAARVAASKIGSLILVAVPQEGTNESVRVLVRGEKLVRRSWPPEMMATFPSIAEMLPEERFPFVDESDAKVDADIWNADSWSRLGLGIYSARARESLARREEAWADVERGFRTSLERASRLRAALRSRPFPAGVSVTAFAGNCTPTSEQLLLRADRSIALYPSELRPEEKPLDALLFGPGDGSIPARSATVRASRSELFCKGHQGIASDPGAHDAMLRTLAEGASDATVDPLARSSQRMETAIPR